MLATLAPLGKVVRIKRFYTAGHPGHLITSLRKSQLVEFPLLFFDYLNLPWPRPGVRPRPGNRLVGDYLRASMVFMISSQVDIWT